MLKYLVTSLNRKTNNSLTSCQGSSYCFQSSVFSVKSINFVLKLTYVITFTPKIAITTHTPTKNKIV